MSKKLVIWLAILGFILLAILCICNSRDKIESDIQARSMAAISDIDDFDGDISVSGRDVTINGVVNSEDLQTKLKQILGSEIGVRKVFSNLKVEIPEVIPDERLAVIQEKLNKIIEFDNIEFQSNTAIILPASSMLIDETAKILKNNLDISIEVAGHSDSIGNSEYNLGLSQRRAEAVLIQLVNRKIDRSRLTAVGYGSGQSIADNNTEEGQQKNRRVEFLIREEK